MFIYFCWKWIKRTF